MGDGFSGSKNLENTVLSARLPFCVFEHTLPLPYQYIPLSCFQGKSHVIFFTDTKASPSILSGFRSGSSVVITSFKDPRPKIFFSPTGKKYGNGKHGKTFITKNIEAYNMTIMGMEMIS